MCDQSTGKTMTNTEMRTSGRWQRAGLAALLAVTLAACGGSAPTLDRIAIGNARTYASVGVPQQLAVTGYFSDGTAYVLTTGVRWRSSNEAVASVDGAGVVTAWAKGATVITATHDNGLSATNDLTARVVTVLRAGATLPGAGTVDLSTSYFRISGLVPGAMYSPTVSGMTDDVDVAVYSDASLGTKLCESITVGGAAESCVAPVPSSGELWVEVNGEWTRTGASFAVDVPGAPAMSLAGALAFPAGFPHTGTVGATREFIEVGGLRPGATYEVRLTGLSADIDLGVFGDPYQYAALCESFQSGTVDDFCNAKATSSGKLFVEIDGTTTVAGGSYTLRVTAK